MKKDPRELRLTIAVEDLCEILDRLQDRHQQLCRVLHDKEKALTDVALDELEDCRLAEEEIIKEVIDEEKERMLVTEEIGDLLDHDEPFTIRVSEMLPHLEDGLAGELRDRRERIKETAEKLQSQNRVNRALLEHSLGHVQVFLDEIVTEQLRNGTYNQLGNQAESTGGSFLMDRRG